MKERPILFSGPMVSAILSGAKTMTRRVVKLNAAGRVQLAGHQWHLDDPEAFNACPYGKVGDRLWVRERMRVIALDYAPRAVRVMYEADKSQGDWIHYPDRLKGTPEIGKCLSYGGYREASRINLEITGVRVERLSEISEEDAVAEGMNPETITTYRYIPGEAVQEPDYDITPSDEFAHLWDKINGKKHPWASNPYVWVVEFKRINQ